jgi:hypothetical protein
MLRPLLLLLALSSCAVDDLDEDIDDAQLQLGNPLVASPGKIDYGTRKVGTVTDVTVTITNTSTVSFQCNLITSNNGAFVPSSTWINIIGPGHSIPLTVKFAPNKAGTYAGAITIRSANDELLGELAVTGAAK